MTTIVTPGPSAGQSGVDTRADVSKGRRTAQAGTPVNAISGGGTTGRRQPHPCPRCKEPALLSPGERLCTWCQVTTYRSRIGWDDLKRGLL